MSETSGALIDAGVKFAVEGIFGSGVRGAQKDAIKATKKLTDLQAEEQRIRNEILRQSLNAQNQQLPLNISNPSLEKTTYNAAGSSSNATPTFSQATVKTLASGGVIIAIAAVGGLMLLSRS